GKTMLVQSTMMSDSGKLYLEVDLAKMVANCSTDVNQMAAKLKSLFDDVARYVNTENQEVVLFMDEFHQVVQLSDAAVEALKPLLADSGVRGIRVITATTPVEFRRHISPNQPLVERLQRINLAQTDRATTISILKGMAERYGVADQFYNDSLYESIYEYTNRYIPANAQPRKSILILDAMIGWHRAEGRKLDKYLLADVIYESEGVNVAFKVDASKIKARLDKKVLSQQFATSVLEQRLQLCVADLNNKGRPMSSLLFSGRSGSGKTEMAKQLAEILFDDDRSLLRMDMTEYANNESLERFRRELTARAWEHPHSIILLDEIEKACSPVTRLLLQVLDDGRLIDENNREVSFTNAYIIMTTNAGSEIYKTIAQYAADDTGSGASMKRYDKLIRNSISTTTGDNRFPPELLGRIDAIVPFQPLSEETMKNIARMKLQQLRRTLLEKHGVKVAMQEKVVQYLVEDNLDTDSDSGGARTVVSKLESEVTTKIAKFINENPGIYNIRVVVEGKLASEDENKLVSDAYINVVPVL
ncbi:MAG: ATP-dependent Clp protease ATP-binding subunit, partial [Clostridia bacterium]|nr:ATP-dependent Clp protease ATP-binding subunit [Clostridia bacterium]